MPTIEVTVTLKIDGVQADPTPITTRLTVDAVQSLDQPRTTGGGYVAYGSLSEVQALLVRTLDQPVSVRLNGQASGSIDLEAGGLLLVFNGSIASGSSTNLKIQNASGETTQLEALTAGVA